MLCEVVGIGDAHSLDKSNRLSGFGTVAGLTMPILMEEVCVKGQR